MDPVLVSACLLGRECRFDARHNRDAELLNELAERGEQAHAFCPEQEGGLETPRPPAWIRGSAAEVLDGSGHLVTEGGVNVTREFLRGAEGARETCRAHGIRRAYLKERSPSCGVRQTHVDGQLVAGPGLTAEVLRRAGVETIGVEGRRS